MKAILVHTPGDASALTYGDAPAPEPKPNEVLISIKAIGVNFIDVYFREGRYPAHAPFIPGNEAAGVVTEVGSAVTDLKAGDRVAYTGHLGSYAELQTMPADRVVKVPESIDFETAAAAMLQGMTAHYLCHDTYRLRAGETALVHACAGGVGQLLVQMAKEIGARVIGTAGSEEKAQLGRAAGADEVIVYATHDFAAETKRLTNGEGVHVVFDGVGKTTFDGDLEILRPRGYLVLFGGASGAVPPFDPMVLSRKGSLFLTRPTLVNYIATREELVARTTSIFEMIASGRLRLRLDRRYPLAEAAQAHRDLEARKTTGKVLLIP
jgi:NADPH2:quinone reductase